MNILITGASGQLAQAVAAALAGEHQLRLIDRVPASGPDRAEVVQADLLDADSMWRAMRGIHAVVHTATPPPDLPPAGLARDQALMDLDTRGTHVLLSAALDAGVRRCVYASTLALFDDYPIDMYISENHRPLPPLDMEVMSRYMGELVCREFARERPIGVTALRMGHLVFEEETADLVPDLSWLDVRDAAQMVAVALRRDSSGAIHWLQRWALCHVAADLPNPRFLIDTAKAMGFRPVHAFTRHWPAQEG